MRLETEDYYEDRPVAHTAQGDLYEDVPFVYATAAQGEFRSRGSRTRPSETTETVIPTPPYTVIGIVCSYTCGFLAQPPGVEGYAHPFRLMAPVVLLRELKSDGMKNGELRRIRDHGGANGFMYLPWPLEDPVVDEWQGHATVALYRPALVTQGLLDARRRVARLSQPAQRILGVRLIQVVSANLFDPTDENLADPDLSDSWAQPATDR